MRLKTVVLTADANESAVAGTVIGAPVGGVQWASDVVIDAELTGNTGGTLDVYIQREVVSGVWRDWVHFAQMSAGAAVSRVTVPCALVSESTITTVGVGTASAATPALAAEDVACPLPLGRIRLVLVSGADTSASFAQTIYVTAQLP